MYDNSGSSLAQTGVAFTIGGYAFSMPTLLLFGGAFVVLGVTIIAVSRVTKRRPKN